MKKILVVVLIIVVFIALRFSGLGDFLTLENLKENKEVLVSFVDQHMFVSVLLFILTYIIVTGLSIPGATLMTFSSGVLFGAVLGTIYSNVGATIGAVVVFLLARYFLGDWVQKKYEKKFRKFNAEMKENSTNYMLSLRFLPLFPFFMVNLFTGITKVNVKKFAWTTSLGIIPGSFVYAFAGAQISDVESLGDILSPGIILAMVLLGTLALLPVFIKKVKKNV